MASSSNLRDRVKAAEGGSRAAALSAEIDAWNCTRLAAIEAAVVWQRKTQPPRYMEDLYERSLFVLRYIADREGMAPNILAPGEGGLITVRNNAGALEARWRDLRKMSQLLPAEDLEELTSLLASRLGYHWESDSVEDLLLLEKVFRTGTIGSELEEAVARAALEVEQDSPHPNRERIEQLTRLIARRESETGPRGGSV